MSPAAYSEDRLVEQPAIALFGELGWETVSAQEERFGPDGTLGRETSGEVVLVPKLRAALEKLNPQLPSEAISSAVDHNELALVRPIFGIGNESCSHGIVSHIYPFLGVTFVAPQDVVEEAGLPKMILGLQRNRYCSFQSGDPLSQADVGIDSDEEVNVIRHNYVAADSDVKFVEAALSVTRECLVGLH